MHKRSYKKTFSTEEAIAIILEENTRGWYQTSLIDDIVALLGFHNPIVKA